MYHLNSNQASQYTRARGIFVDRWGTLLELPKKGFSSHFSKVRFTPGAIDALFAVGQRGFNLYLIGNEPSVAFGEQSLEQYNAFEEKLLTHLRSQGVNITRSYACTDDPEGKAPNNKESVFHLPNTGMLYHAAQEDGISLSDSWVIGDSCAELIAGWRANCRVAGVETGVALRDDTMQMELALRGATLAEVLGDLKDRTTARSA